MKSLLLPHFSLLSLKQVRCFKTCKTTLEKW